MNDFKRFFKNIDVACNAPCWVWIGCPSRDRHVQVNVNGRMEYAHRWAYKLFQSNDIDNKVIMHTCDNPRCVNPIHLIVGTQKDNIQDAVKKGRVSRTHQPCKEKHPCHKLTQQQVNDIRTEYKWHDSACGIYGLSKKYNTSPRNIHYIITNKTWKQ